MQPLRFSFPIACLGCLLALETGTFVFFQTVILFEEGFSQLLLGVRLFILAQYLLLPIFLVLCPLGAFLRMILFVNFQADRKVAIRTGGCFGAVAALLLCLLADSITETVWLTLLGLLAGICAGHVWYMLERRLSLSSDTTT